MREKINSIVAAGANHLSSCMSPLIPVIIAGSLLKLLHLLLGIAGLAAGPTGELVRIMGDAPFYFLPVLVSVTAAQHFGADLFYALGAACMLMTPDFLALVQGTEPVSFLGIPVVHANYAYNVLPVILLVWLIARLEPRARKHFPKALLGTVYPLLVFAASSACGFLAVGPFGALVSRALAGLLAVLSARAGVVAWALLAGLMPLLVPAGMHWIFVTTAITQMGTAGVETGIMAACFISNMTLAGADFAVVLRTRDGGLRGQALGAGIAALLSGVSEPTLFGVCLREKAALRGAMLAGAAVGIYEGIVGINCYVYSFPAFGSILMFQNAGDPANLWKAAAAGVLSVLAGFLFTLAGLIRRGRSKETAG